MFDELDVMKNYTGQVLLLEEDYYLAPDIITTLQMTLNLKKKSVPPSTGPALVSTALLQSLQDFIFLKNSFSFNHTSCFESYIQRFINFAVLLSKKTQVQEKMGFIKRNVKERFCFVLESARTAV